MLPICNLELIALATTFHGLAILSTIFRLWYRWNIARMWWDDAWALVALLADIMCLITPWLERPTPGANIPNFFTTGSWIFSLAFPTVIWASRISIVISIARVSQPVGVSKCIAVGVGIAFAIMWPSLLGQRIQVCLKNGCLITRHVVMAQTITDCIADVLLTGLPVLFLRNMKLSRNRKLLILSTFSASMVINVVTALQAVELLRRTILPGVLIVGHVKYALSLVVCNLLVIVTWLYRIMNKDKPGLDDLQLETSKVELTTVEIPQARLSQETRNPSATSKSSSWSFRGPGRSGTPSVVTSASRASDV